MENTFRLNPKVQLQVTIDKMNTKKEMQKIMRQQQKTSINLQKSARELKESSVQTALNSKLMNSLSK